MTTAENRKFNLLKRQLDESLRQASICARELAEMTREDDDDDRFGANGNRRGVDGNGDRRDDGKTQKRPLLDKGTFEVVWKNKKVYLGNTVLFRFMERLARCPNFHVTHLALLKDVWEIKNESSKTARLRTAVRRLRATLREGGMDGLAKAIVAHEGHYVLDVNHKK